MSEPHFCMLELAILPIRSCYRAVQTPAVFRYQAHPPGRVDNHWRLEDAPFQAGRPGCEAFVREGGWRVIAW